MIEQRSPESPEPCTVLILTGPPASGKNTVGLAIADRLDRCALVDVDQLRAMVRRPHVASWYDGEGTAQQRLGARNACQLATNFAAANFSVVILDFLTDHTLPLYRGALAGLAVRIVRLLPSLEEAQRRNRERGLWVKPDRVTLLYAQMAAFRGADETIDNTLLPADPLADRLAPLLAAS
jgi:hypothetical protein